MEKPGHSEVKELASKVTQVAEKKVGLQNVGKYVDSKGIFSTFLPPQNEE